MHFQSPGLLAIAALCVALFHPPRPARAFDQAPAPRVVGFAVEKYKDIAYRTVAGAERERHHLDVYVPKGHKDFPVILFVHGGTWKWGDKSLYGAVGEAFAKRGIGVVICNYRLSPKVQHPAHAEDVAAAFAWTADNIVKYGGRPDELFVCGHSAGGHLVSLLATDPTYLKAVKHSPGDIKGVISISGVYKIYHTESVFHPAFGKDETVCKMASPLTHVNGKHPPFLLAYADRDYDHLDVMAKDMDAALRKVASPCDLLLCRDRNHINIIINVVDPGDPLNKSILEFVAKHAK